MPPKRGHIVARRANTTNVSEDFQKHFFVSRAQHLCPPKMLRAWKNEWRHLRNMVTSAMVLPLCVLVLPSPFIKEQLSVPKVCFVLPSTGVNGSVRFFFRFKEIVIFALEFGQVHPHPRVVKSQKIIERLFLMEALCTYFFSFFAARVPYRDRPCSRA